MNPLTRAILRRLARNSDESLCFCSAVSALAGSSNPAMRRISAAGRRMHAGSTDTATTSGTSGFLMGSHPRILDFVPELPSFADRPEPSRTAEVEYFEDRWELDQWGRYDLLFLLWAISVFSVPTVCAQTYVDSSKNQCIRIEWSDRSMADVEMPVEGPSGSKTTHIYAAIEAANVALRQVHSPHSAIRDKWM